jgi:hypothetical protein
VKRLEFMRKETGEREGKIGEREEKGGEKGKGKREGVSRG